MNPTEKPEFLTPPTPPLTTDLALKPSDRLEVFDPAVYKAEKIASLQDLLTEYRALPAVVVDQAAYEKAVEVERRLAAREKAVEGEIEDGFCVPARTKWQNANALKKEVVGLLAAPREALAKLRTTYRQKEEEKERRQAELDAAVERERQRLADEARAAEEKVARDHEEGLRLELAAIAEKSGDHVRAAVILDTPQPLERAEFVAPPPPPPAPARSAAPVARVAGEIRGKDWTGSVVNRKAFFQALADGAIPFLDDDGKPILEVRPGWLNAKAKKHEDRMGNYIPGTAASWTLKSGVRS